MVEISVHIIAGGRRVPVLLSEHAEDPLVVPSGYLLIEIEGTELPASAFVDGKTQPLITDDRRAKAYLTVDTSRSVGFHHVQLSRKHQFIFATDDAKLRLDGIKRVLEYIESEGLSWGGQLYFSDGAAIRHEKIDYAWLTRNFPKLLQIVEEVAARPHGAITNVRSRTRPAAGRLLLYPTVRYLRTDPKMLLEESTRGPLLIAGRRYVPRMAAMSVPLRSYDTVGNRRIVWLLKECAAMAQSLAARVPADQRKVLASILAGLYQSMERHPFAQLSVPNGGLPLYPAPEEITDERYEAAFQLYRELTDGLKWSPGLRLTSRMAFVSYADEIYQAFVALALARAFDAKLIYNSLVPQLEGPCFRSSDYEIYYETVPPRKLFSNWRDHSSRPVEMRPDLTLVHVRSGRAIMLDAKYRDSDGRTPSSALGEVQKYMHSFSRNVMGVCYPSAAEEVYEVTGNGKTIVEIPIAPSERLKGFLADKVKPKLETMLEPPPA